MTAGRQTESRQERWVNEPGCLINLLFKPAQWEIHANKMLQCTFLLVAFLNKWITSRLCKSTRLNDYYTTNRWFSRRLFSDPNIIQLIVDLFVMQSAVPPRVCREKNRAGFGQEPVRQSVYHQHKWVWGTFVIFRDSSCSSAKHQCILETSEQFGKWK